MTISNKQLNGQSSRRQFLKGASSTAAMVAGISVLPAHLRAATNMRYMCWEGYDKPSIVEAFESANDATLNIDLISDSAAGLQSWQREDIAILTLFRLTARGLHEWAQLGFANSWMIQNLQMYMTAFIHNSRLHSHR